MQELLVTMSVNHLLPTISRVSLTAMNDFKPQSQMSCDFYSFKPMFGLILKVTTGFWGGMGMES